MATSPPDMRVPPPDMVPAGDMAFPPPTLTIPGTCVTTTVTLSSFYTSLIAAKCAIASCHVSGYEPPNYGPDMTAFRTDVVNVSANRAEVPSLSYIKPSDPDNSFILYKVLGQQDKIPVGGGQMPQTGGPLSAAEQCTLINWVRSGAT